MYIITGGAGFIGSVIADEINREFPDNAVVISDYMEENDKWKNLNGRILKNIINPNDLHDFLNDNKKGVTAVIHMGAISATTETDVEKIAHENIRTTLRLFNWCTRHDKPFIYASSAATFGDGKNGFDDVDNTEYLDALRPLNAYGFSKAMVDKAIVRETYKPRQWVGLKFFNVYGPNEYHKGGQASVVYHTFNQIQKSGEMKLFKSHNPDYTDGGQMRDFVYVKDIARAVVWFLKNTDVSGIFNMGSGKARTFKDLAEATFGAMNKKINISYVDTPEHIRKHYQYYTQANMKKFASVAPDFKFTNLEEGVIDYVQNHLLKDDPNL